MLRVWEQAIAAAVELRAMQSSLRTTGAADASNGGKGANMVEDDAQGGKTADEGRLLMKAPWLMS